MISVGSWKELWRTLVAGSKAKGIYIYIRYIYIINVLLLLLKACCFNQQNQTYNSLRHLLVKDSMEGNSKPTQPISWSSFKAFIAATPRWSPFPGWQEPEAAATSFGGVGLGGLAFAFPFALALGLRISFFTAAFALGLPLALGLTVSLPSRLSRLLVFFSASNRTFSYHDDPTRWYIYWCWLTT